MLLTTLAALGIRIAGIVIGLYALRNGAFYLAAAGRANEDPWLFVAVTPMVMMMAAAVCMIAMPGRVAAKLVPAPVTLAPAHKTEAEDPPTLGELQGLGCALLGIYFLVEAVLDASYMVSLYFTTQNLGYDWVWSESYVATVAVAAGEFAAAVWLMFGAEGLFRLIRWAKRVHAD